MAREDSTHFERLPLGGNRDQSLEKKELESRNATRRIARRTRECVERTRKLNVFGWVWSEDGEILRALQAGGGAKTRGEVGLDSPDKMDF